MDPKARVELARSAGKPGEPMPKTYRYLLFPAEQRPKTPAPLAHWKGTVAVTRPDGKTSTAVLAPFDGETGADLAMDQPGRYEFTVEVESGGKKGKTAFAYVIK